MPILLIIIFFSTSIFAQQDYTFQSLYRSFEEGKQYYTLAKSIIHIAPSVLSEKIATLPIATTIQIEERMDELAKINGFRTNWYRISFPLNGFLHEGFIWGGNIAVGAFVAQESPDIFFLYGIEKIEVVERSNYIEERILLQLNACRDTFLLDKLEVEAMGSLYTQTQGNALGNKGLESIKEVIEINFSDGYCGGVSASATTFWDGQKLHFVQLLSNGYSNEYFSNKFFIYPHDDEGEIGRIILREEEGEFGENKEAIYTQKVDKEFVWTGDGLKEG